MTWDDDWMDIVAVTCNMTYAECAALTNDGEDHRAIAYEHDQSQTHGFYTGGNNDTYRASYIKYTFGPADYDVRVNSNGTITWNYPSSDLVTPGTPTASKGSVSNHSVSVTPSVTNPGGYIVGGTITGSPVTVSASELVSGTLSITSNGTHDVTNYASATVNVSGGGGGEAVTEKQVNFIDYDGTILYSYTKAEAEALTALPANPSHSGLVAQGWNWTLAQIKAQLTALPDGPVWVGQLYVTQSRATEIDVLMNDSTALSPILTIAVNGTITVDWGDNSTPDEVTGTNLSSRKAVPHTYASIGNYTVTISATTGTYYSFFGSSSYTLLREGTNGNRNRRYSSAIQAVRLGENVTIYEYAFYSCYSMRYITISNSTGISGGRSTFQYCYSLKSLTLNNTFTTTYGYFLSNAKGLKSISIPYELVAMGENFLSYASSLDSITIPTNIQTLGVSTFASSGIKKLCLSNIITSIPNNFADTSSALSSIIIPSGVTTIGNYAFQSIAALRSVTIPTTVESIGTSAFSGCNSLMSLTIPENVISIGANAFANTYSMSEIHFIPTTPPSLANTNAFSGIQSDCKIYVPSESLEDYQTATNWSTYASYMVGE